MSGKTVLVGVGAVNSLGYSSAAIHAAVRSGISNFQEHPSVATHQGEAAVVCRSPLCDWDVSVPERLVRLASAALDDLIRSVPALVDGRRRRVALRCALPCERPGLRGHDVVETSAAIERHFSGVVSLADYRTLDLGHAGSLVALSELDCEREPETVWIVGGVDSYLDERMLRWIEAQDLLHKSENAWGFIPGEGACFGVFCAPAMARELSRQPLYQIDAIGVGLEPNPCGTGGVCVGRGLSDAVHSAVSALPEGARIGRICTDLNGESYRGDELGFTLTRIAERLDRAWSLAAPADCWGDIGAASGISLLMRHGLDAGVQSDGSPHHLVLCSSAAAERSAVLARKVGEAALWQ